MSNHTGEARHTTEITPEIARAAQETMQGMLARSATDAEFRRKLLNHPRAAVREFTGREVSESFNVVFMENTADATIVLPDPVDPAAELSEREMEAVSGGGVLAVVSLITAAVAVYNCISDHE